MVNNKEKQNAYFFLYVREIKHQKINTFLFTFCVSKKMQFVLIIFKMIEVRHAPFQTSDQLSG